MSHKKRRRNINKLVPRGTILGDFHHKHAEQRLLLLGSEVLSDAELLSLLLPHSSHSSHSSRENPHNIAGALLLHFGSLRRLLLGSQTETASVGLTQGAFVALQAALELARRHYHEAMLETPVINTTTAAREFLRMRLRDLPFELFGAVFLDSQHHVILFSPMFRGTVDGSAVHVREVVREALSRNAVATILVHNHPSGYPAPSPEDHEITRRLKEALSLVDITVNDHLIVAGTEIVSFAEQGLL